MGGCAEWMTTVGWIIWNCGMGGMCGIGGGYGMPMWWGIGAMCCAGYGCGTCCAMGGITGCTAAAWVGAGAAVAGACMGHGRCIAPAVDGWGGESRHVPPSHPPESAGAPAELARLLAQAGAAVARTVKQLMHRSQSRRTQPAHSPQRLRGCRRVAVRETMPFVPEVGGGDRRIAGGGVWIGRRVDRLERRGGGGRHDRLPSGHRGRDGRLAGRNSPLPGGEGLLALGLVVAPERRERLPRRAGAVFGVRRLERRRLLPPSPPSVGAREVEGSLSYPDDGWRRTHEQLGGGVRLA